jgi:hypothetical protein
MMSRNFSNISVGVIKQMMTAFKPEGLTSADGKMIYAGGWGGGGGEEWGGGGWLI